MADRIIENNQVSITGKIVTGFTFSHQVYGEGFYTMDLLVKRLSDSEDRIPVMVSERLVDVTQDYVGQYVEIHGQFRSYNRHEEKHNRLVLSAFARELKFLEEEDSLAPVNQIFLDGYICKPPVYRKTPLGREIADLLLAVNRPYGKSDYIPCICWGRNARYASAFEVGGHVLIWGRIQSREYMKRIGENETQKRIAYEVSVMCKPTEVAGNTPWSASYFMEGNQPDFSPSFFCLHFCWFCGNISILKMAQFAVLICKARYLEYNERYHLRRRHCEECY